MMKKMEELEKELVTTVYPPKQQAKKTNGGGEPQDEPPAAWNANDFTGDIEPPAAPPFEEEQAAEDGDIDPDLRWINNKYCVLPIGGKVRVLTFEEWPRPRGNGRRRVAVFFNFTDFKNLLSNRMKKIITAEGKEEFIPLGKWWLNHRDRRQYDGLIFRPGGPSVIENKFNLWRGWGIEPTAGKWSRMRKHIREVLANNDSESEQYILNWLAWCVQNPAEQAEVALVLQGGRGTGKGVVGRTLCNLFGQHGLHISSTSHLAGQFNAHLLDCAFLFADEAFWPGDKSTEGTLKRLITEDTLMIERKGVDAVPSDNMLHILMSSNEDWIVPAGLDERRFAIFSLADTYQKDEVYFAPLYTELEAGGAAAMLHDLLSIDLTDWHPRRDIPNTEALLEQQMLTLQQNPLRFYDYHLHETGRLPRSHDDLYRVGDAVAAADLLKHARSCVSLKQAGHINETSLGRYLREHVKCTEAPRTNNRRHYTFPPLQEGRVRWQRQLRGIKWNDRNEWGFEELQP